MARKKGQEGSMSGWFRAHFRNNPDALNLSNADILNLWSEANGGKEPDERVKNAMANVKSSVKKELGLGRKKKGKGGRPPKEKAAANGAGEAPKPARVVSAAALENLEYQVDRCLGVARGYGENDPALAEVATLLHRARNRIILRRGE